MQFMSLTYMYMFCYSVHTIHMLVHVFFDFFFAGLGEVSESLENDGNLTPADFIDDQNASPDICASQSLALSHDCLTSCKAADCDEVKTPLTSRYKNKISETPCLFSQDESVFHTPASSKWFCFLPTKYMPLYSTVYMVYATAQLQ